MPEPQDPSVRERAAEQHHVDALYTRLDADAARLRAEAAQILRDPADDLREPRLALLGRRAAALAAAEHHLCFGRIDAADGATPGAAHAALHIGRTGITGPDGEPLLVDWRADAARPFYAATPASPEGLRRRRHLTLDGRTVTRVSDEILDGSAPGAGDVVGDGPLAAALGARRTGRMRDVVATLQAEQDAIVRSPHRGVTVVEGGPGTGKTVVALHRAAYVLAMFDSARADGVLVLGPGDRFLDYIGQVLPSLGENDVVLSTPTALLADAAAPPARGGRQRPPRPAAVASDRQRRRLGDARWAARLAAVVRASQAPDGVALAVTIDGDRIALRPAELAEARATAQASGLAHNKAREVFGGLVADALAAEVEARARVFLARMDEDMEVLTGGADIEGAVAADLARLGFAADAGGRYGHRAAVAELDPEALRRALGGDPQVEAAVDRAWPRLTPGGVVAQALTRTARGGPPGDAAAARAEDGRRRWTDAHLPLLDEAAALLDGPPERTFGHVVVDEAQELTPMQWRAVLRRCPSRSMTIVGDLAQAGPATGAATWEQALGALATRAQVRTLTVCYRTTQQVLAEAAGLAERIAPAQQRSRAIRTGPPVRRVGLPADDALVQVVRAEAVREAALGGLVGVVAADQAAGTLASALGDVAGVQVVPVAQVRGLEFDAAIVVDPDQIRVAREGGERDLYVALTRPTTRLVAVGPDAAATGDGHHDVGTGMPS
ncbi:helicase [Xylanimonas allomyrinae]|uniref:Helicase n=1 Tax=Xylanimonas allomyrinae TaxID=2509459 RepID=A0A4P6EKY4_9MICO|nr:AAA family ATPase [Xylanimonas allomyrinae]QAY62836.1 helicase [Xylanimonas allomyrinae]